MYRNCPGCGNIILEHEDLCRTCKTEQEQALDFLVEQAQELNMGYESTGWIRSKDRLPNRDERWNDGTVICADYGSSCWVESEYPESYDMWMPLPPTPSPPKPRRFVLSIDQNGMSAWREVNKDYVPKPGEIITTEEVL